MTIEEMVAASTISRLAAEQGWTAATLSRLVHDFITAKGLNGELLTYIEKVIEDEQHMD